LPDLGLVLLEERMHAPEHRARLALASTSFVEDESHTSSAARTSASVTGRISSLIVPSPARRVSRS
jgi:hypothetical protein